MSGTASMKVQITQVIEDLKAGRLDAQIPALSDTINNRKAVLARVTAAQLGPGDTIHFSDAVRPRYLSGLPITVVRVNQKSVTVSIPTDPEYGTYAGARHTRLPNDMIEELS